MRVAVVGSGFAGSILARVLRVQGHPVALIDRGRHPRFALGESSTPLAALSLERLAARYGLPDLHAMAAWGRWVKELPHLRRGLKRGFSFYGHTPGKPFANSPANDRRLLVAASPSDAIADTHWLREDVDTHLARQAAAAGAELLEETELDGLERRGGLWILSGRRRGAPVRIEADLIVDASGPGGFLARHLPIPSSETELQTSLVYGHFEGDRPLHEIVPMPPGPYPAPYPEDKAAVHHLLAEGWMYVLPFDHGVKSAGFVLQEDDGLPPEESWRRLLGRYPSLWEAFGDARPVRPIARIPRLQHRLARAAGDGWALLPHAFQFLTPLFSTGIAWSLLAVERLALLLEGPEELALDRYGELLDREADHLRTLTSAAYRAIPDFDRFAAYTFVYFAAASFSEARQRLLPASPGGEPWPWEGFLGSTDPLLAEIPRLAENRNEDAVRALIAPRNLAGLADPARHRLYPVDLDPLVETAHLLGLTREDIRREIPRLRGEA